MIPENRLWRCGGARHGVRADPKSTDVETPGAANPATPPSSGALPQWDANREPQLLKILGMEVVVRDAVIHRGRREAVLLVGLTDPHHGGPFVLTACGMVHSVDADGAVSYSALESLRAGIRIEVPGQEVIRLRTVMQEVARGAWIEWACFAYRLDAMLPPLGSEQVEREGMLSVTRGKEKAKRVYPVTFRVAGG